LDHFIIIPGNFQNKIFIFLSHTVQIRSKILLDIGTTCKNCFGYLPSCHVYLFSGISHTGKHDKCYRQCYCCGRQLSRV